MRFSDRPSPGPFLMLRMSHGCAKMPLVNNYCADPLCDWVAPESWADEENAWTDLRAHMDHAHWPSAGVREEDDHA